MIDLKLDTTINVGVVFFNSKGLLVGWATWLGLELWGGVHSKVPRITANKIGDCCHILAGKKKHHAG